MSTDHLIHAERTRMALPMTAAQRGIYYAQQIDADVPMSVAAFVEFHGRIDFRRLSLAVTDAARETESGLLRLIAHGEDEPTVIVDDERNVELQRRDFSGCRDPRAQALAWMDSHRAQVPDLMSDPLLQTYLLDLGDEHSIWYCWGHHLAFDGYAAMYMMLRVAQRYTAADGAPLPDADIASMADIAAMDAAYRDSDCFTADLDHWSHRLATDLPSTSFATASDAAAPLATVVSHILDDDVVEQIRLRARDLQVRPASVITAAVALYLARFNNTCEAMLSLPVAARDTGVLRTSAGLTSNVVPVRTEIGATDGLRVADLIQDVNREIKSAVHHQHFRHEDITARVLGAAGGRRGFFGPMVNVMLFFKHIDFGSLRGALNILSTGPVEDASVNVYDAIADGMSLDLEANPNVYSDAEVNAHHRRLIDFLARFVHCDPNLPVTSVPLTAAPETTALAAASHGPTVDHGSTTLTDLLDESYRRHSDRVALIEPDGPSLTYAEVHRRVAAASAGLRARGIGAESVVGILLPRSIDQHIALHAVIAAGAVFVPLSPDEPAARLRHILDIAAPDLVVTEDAAGLLGATTVRLHDLERSRDVPGSSPIATPHPDAGAYLLFTSGSTGAPKGVLVSHRALVNRLLWMQDTYRIDARDRVLHKTPASFDVSVWEYFWPMVAGASTVIAAPDGHRDPEYLCTVIDRTGVTALHFVPSMLAAFTETLGADDQSVSHTRTSLSSVRMIFTSGEALTPGVVAAVADLTDAPIHNLYGPTEAAIDVTHHDACSADEQVMPIGLPVHNTAAYVLDRRLDPMPVGAVGELYLGGVQLARGYHARPDLTSDHFVADPFTNGGRLYRTGDLVRRRADGALEYLGRADSQIKIRGQRVELGEIEHALGVLPGVRGAAAVVRDDLLADRVIVGYVSGDGLDGRDLRAELAAALPSQMIPTAIAVCATLPTTANGKLDRSALPEPDFGGGTVDADGAAAPITGLEQLVHDTVCAVLGVPSISMTADFFDIGGNSLSATRLAARLSTATGYRIGIRTVFDAADIASIAEALRALGADDDADSTRAADDPAIVDGPVRLSPAQHRIWLATRLDPTAASSYNMPFTVRFTGDLDVDALAAALNDVVARHEPLRTTVVDIDGTPHQQVHDAEGHLLSIETDTDDTAAFAARPFDLGVDLPVRARITTDGPDLHDLVMVVHHIAADGWSLAPLADDLATAYRARHAGVAPAWSPLPISYRQAAADRNAWLDDPTSDAAAQIEFWRRRLDDAPVDTELPYDRSPMQADGRSGGHLRVPIDCATRERLFAMAHAHGVTAFMVVHAAVAALLRTVGTTDDVVVGTPVSGRGDDRLDRLIGMFVNTLVLRTPVDKNASFADLLAVVRESDLAAFDNADVPFDRIVTELNPPRSRSGQPFFDVSVALEDDTAAVFDVAGLGATATPVDTGTSKFDLEFTVIDRPATTGADRMDLVLGYADSVFERSTAVGLASRFVRLLQAVTDDPDRPIGDIRLLDPVDRLDLVPATGGGSRPAEHLSELLACAVAAESSRPAIVDVATDHTVTYRELDAASNRLSRALIAAGAGPERFVALALPRSIDWMVALWAVTKSGAAWVPVDPSYPAERIAFMLDDSGADIVVTDQRSQPHLPTNGQTVITLDGDHPATGSDAPIDDADRITDLDVDQPAYLIYTSGTTGRPKGVVVHHRGLADFAAEQVTRLALTERSRTLHLASPSFDASVLEVMMAVGAGASMYIAGSEVFGGSELSRLMSSSAITHAFLTPSLLTTMSPDDLPQLETLVIGGEHPNAEAVRRWARDRRLINAYGPTEATVVATMSPSIETDEPVTIGRPIRGVSALVLDERLRPVAPGVVGELYLSGPHLARGYHRVPSLTSKHFIANPFSPTGERMYRTGDLVRWDTGHRLEFRGRADHQAKVQGHRIELDEVDAGLLADAEVRDAVTVVSGSDESARLVSYITAAHGAGLDADATHAIRQRLADRLPRHMVPSTVICLAAIPVTTAGKVDTRALPVPEPLETSPTSAPPEGTAELAVADAVAEILGIDAERIGRDDDFFQLGGNSLLATQLATALEKVLDREVPVRALFDDAKVSAIARLFDASAGTDLDVDGTELDDTRDRARGGRPPLTHDASDVPVEPGAAQAQMWFLNRLAGPDDSTAYHIAFALDLRGDLDVTALEAALRHTVDRHEPLRTRYPDVDGRPSLEVLSADDVDLALVVEHVTADVWDARARDVAARRFDLTVDAPLRTALHRLPDHDDGSAHHRLTLVIHHIAADGASMAPLARDVGVAYAALRDGRGPTAPTPSVTYRDYLRWHRDLLSEITDAPRGRTRFDELTDHWTADLHGMSHTPVLASDVDAPAATGRADTVEITLPTGLRDAVDGIDVRGATRFMRWHAVLATLLHRMSGDPASHLGARTSDIVIGTPVAGRTDAGLSELVGMFVNSVPLRTRVDSARSFDELLAAVRDTDLEAITHADMSFERIVAAVAPPRTGHHPIFGVALVIDDLSPTDPADGLDLPGLTVTAVEVATGGARFDLEVRITGDAVRFTFDTGLYTERRVADLADRFTALAQQIADDPRRTIGDLRLPEAVAGSPTSTTGAPAPRHLADMIDRAVGAHPDTVALDDGGTQVTYRRAGRLTDRWARTLVGYGVGPGDVVAVAIGRSIDSVLATWAVTKAGATVLPVDQRHPAERIRHMLDDSRAALGITTDPLLDGLPTATRWVTVDQLVDDAPGARRLLRDRPVRHIDGAAYLIYTSGTTGAPKGVQVSHRGLAAFAATQTRRFGVTPTSRTLHFASPSFDASMLELLMAVDAGATMVIAPTSVYGGDELTEFLADQRVSHAFLTPAALGSAAPRALPDLQSLGVGGESFGRELVARWGTDRVMLNCYGPTETTIVAMMAHLVPEAPITIGTPVDGARALVLDARLRPVPPYAPGELYLMGPGLAHGYLGRAGQTSTSFVAAPDGSGHRMYRTGDLASIDLNGAVRFHGRTDRQVKVRGFRIELDEIDSVLSAHPAVDAAVTVVQGTGDAAHLIGYVTGRGAAAAVADLPAHVAARLPRHMVPSVVVPIDAIPMTVNGKVDHAALPAPDRPKRPASRPPAPGAESVLADIVAQTLGLASGSVGADDDFFALGGTSLQATTIVSRINAVHRGEPIRVAAVFDEPSIGRLARLLDVDDDIASTIPRPTATARSASTDRPERFPLAPMQKRLWSLHRSDPGSVDYAMPFALRLHGALDIAALRESLVDVLARHAVLRTTYAETDDGPVGIIADDPDVLVPTAADLRIEGDAAAQHVAELSARPFDLTREIGFRVAITGDGDRHDLLLVLHHLVADGASMPVIIGDLLQAYRARTGAGAEGFRRIRAVPDFADYALGIDSDRERDDLAYWIDRLRDAPAQTSVDADPGQAGQAGGADVNVPIEASLRDEITAFARSHSTPPFTVLHTALAILLNRLGVGNDLVIGSPVDTRGVAAVGTGSDLSTTVGMFVNTVALRTVVDPAATAQSLVERVRADDLAAWDHLNAPFDDIVSALNPPRLPGRGPLFQVALSVHDFADSIAGEQMPVSDDLVGEIAELETDTAKFDLQFTVTGMSAASTGANLSLTYARGRYGRAAAAQLAVRLLRVVRALVSDPLRCVGDIRITDPLEVASLAPVSGPPATAPRTYGRLLDDAVRRNPDGIAVRTEDADGSVLEVTYREMDRRANRLARLVLAHRAAEHAEPVVAIALPRSIEAIVAIWAVVRTGAAYLPVDPTYPADRIAHMLDDAHADLIVTTTADGAGLGDGHVRRLELDDPGVVRALAETSAAPVTDGERARPLRVDQLAYLIYTSGSTGRPKGVLVPHRGLAAVHDELGERMRPGTDSRVLHFASPSFDASVLEFLLAAAGAATLVVAPPGVFGGADLQDFLARQEITHAFITPAAVATMSPKAVPALTALAIGGEAMAPELVRGWSTGRTLLNVYGPTETTIITTGSAPLAPDDRVRIGRPNNGVSALVLDDRLHPVPTGVAGELYLIGPQVTRGYHDRRGLTSTRYVAAPTVLGDEFAGQRMYRTGDQVRWTDDHCLEYVGRTDAQVQVRGFRVELGEIDDALTEQPNVRAAVTIADASAGHTVLHGYVAVDDDHEVTAGALRRALARRLPRHMVPATITVLDRLPVTSVGKVDRRALPAPTEATAPTGDEPIGDVEHAVATRFAEILGVDRVGRDDNFFDIGGDSLLATTLATRLREAGHPVSVPDVFAAPTPAELAAALTDALADVGSSVRPTTAALAPVLPLRRPTHETGKAPLFVVHPAIGLAWSFTGLLPHVERDRPVYGLQNPALSGSDPAASIDELAADYVRRIREIAPHGPYRLLGWSLGGLIAHEAAVALQEVGETVEQLVILDSYVLADHPNLPRGESIRGLLGEFGIDTASMPADPDEASMTAAVRAAGGPLADLSADDLAAIRATFDGAGSLADGWHPRIFDGDAVFVTADRRAAGVDVEARDDWHSRIRGSLADVRVDCTHARLLLPENVAQFGHVCETRTSAADTSAVDTTAADTTATTTGDDDPRRLLREEF